MGSMLVQGPTGSPVYEHSGHPEVPGHCTGVLPSSSPEAGQHVVGGVVALPLQGGGKGRDRIEWRGGEGR